MTSHCVNSYVATYTAMHKQKSNLFTKMSSNRLVYVMTLLTPVIENLQKMSLDTSFHCNEATCCEKN